MDGCCQDEYLYCTDPRLGCVSSNPEALRSAARFTNLYIELVGQKAASQKCVLIGTSKRVRGSMKDWNINDEGHRWTVQLDVRDLGGHLDATKRARAATLAKRTAAVLTRVPVVGALPLGFGGKLRILRTMHTPVAIHGVEASHLSFASFRKLRSPYVGAVTSGSMSLANLGTVLSLLDGPQGCDPGYHVVWCRFRLLRRYCWGFGLGSYLWSSSCCLWWFTWSWPYTSFASECF